MGTTPQTQTRPRNEADPMTADAMEISITRDIAASPERVFALWTDPDAMMTWFGMAPNINERMVFEAHPGGAWAAYARDPEGNRFRMEGVVQAIEPARRLLQTWAYVDPEGTRHNETEVEVLFAPSAKGCLVTVHHRKIRFTPEAFQEGWRQSLDRIEAAAAA